MGGGSSKSETTTNVDNRTTEIKSETNIDESTHMTDNSVTDNSVTDNSVTDNSTHITENNVNILCTTRGEVDGELMAAFKKAIEADKKCAQALAAEKDTQKHLEMRKEHIRLYIEDAVACGVPIEEMVKGFKLFNTRNKWGLEPQLFNQVYAEYFTGPHKLMMEMKGRFEAIEGKSKEAPAGEEKIVAVEGKVGVIEGKVSTIEGKVAAIEGNSNTAATAADGKVVACKQKVTALEGKITADEQKITALEGTCATLQTTITAMETRLAAAEAKGTALESKLAALEQKMSQLPATAPATQ